MKHRVTVGHGSHLPVLMMAMDISTGPVLEIGMGFHSTNFLHWKCHIQKRLLHSYEDSPEYAGYFKRLENESHRIHIVKSYDEIPEDKYWSVILIDHAPNTRRIVEIDRLKHMCDYMIIHDTEERRKETYKYYKVLDKFKYRYDFNGTYPETSVVSNRKILDEFKKL